MAPSVRHKKAQAAIGVLHSAATKAKMRQNRTGKGLGVCGTWHRTSEWRAKAAERAAQYMREHPSRVLKSYKCGWVFSEKADQMVYIRSSWERRVLWILDQYPEVEDVRVEPFAIPYLWEGTLHQYVPDFLIDFDGFQELWEVKPLKFCETAQNQAKFRALHAYATDHGMNSRVVTKADIERMECKTAVMIGLQAPEMM